MPKKFDVEKFNKILETNNQKLKAVSITKNLIRLTNGVELTNESDIRKCKRRVINGESCWKENFDVIYGLDRNESIKTEAKCKSEISKKGGISCQQIHGDKIKKNLNTGNPWSKGLKGKYPYSFKHTNETKIKISKSNSGEKNGMFGQKMSSEEKIRKSLLMKEKILSGKFTPNSNNRNTHWDSFYQGKKFRSSWEALYQCLDPDADYESIRIEYSFNSKNYIYIVDFVNHTTKKLVEIKPKELLDDKKTQAKISAAKQWCEQNNYEFILADKNYLLSYSIPVNLNDFDIKTQSKIRKLYETN